MYVQVIRDYNYPKIPHEIHILTFMLVIFFSGHSLLDIRFLHYEPSIRNSFQTQYL
jgi:hypothetical protein